MLCNRVAKLLCKQNKVKPNKIHTLLTQAKVGRFSEEKQLLPKQTIIDQFSVYWLTLLFFLLVFLVLLSRGPGWHTGGSRPHPLLAAAKQSIRFRRLQLVVVVTLVERHQEHLVVLSSSVGPRGGKRKQTIVNKQFLKSAFTCVRTCCTWQRSRCLSRVHESDPEPCRTGPAGRPVHCSRRSPPGCFELGHSCASFVVMSHHRHRKSLLGK